MTAQRALLITYPVLTPPGLEGTAWFNARSGAVECGGSLWPLSNGGGG